MKQRRNLIAAVPTLTWLHTRCSHDFDHHQILMLSILKKRRVVMGYVRSLNTSVELVYTLYRMNELRITA